MTSCHYQQTANPKQEKYSIPFFLLPWWPVIHKLIWSFVINICLCKFFPWSTSGFMTCVIARAEYNVCKPNTIGWAWASPTLVSWTVILSFIYLSGVHMPYVFYDCNLMELHVDNKISWFFMLMLTVQPVRYSQSVNRPDFIYVPIFHLE